MAVFFDVGANDGSSMDRFLYAGHTLFTFEPNPDLHRLMMTKFGLHSNWYCYNCAISDYNGIAEFNVCVTHDRGCSSLLEVSEAGKTQWGGRQDMIPDHKIKVDVHRLDNLLDWNQIPEIEYFHCDTQGSDLKVLQGMGIHLRKIKEGVVEAAAKEDILYKGQNSIKDTIAFLEQNGFAITFIQANDIQHNEVNIGFRRVDNLVGNTSN